MKTLCIYHGNCADGFTAAWVVRRALGAGVEFHPGVYPDPPPDVTGKHVVLVDFSYPRLALEKMVDQAASVTILDHHKSAQADLEGLPGAVTVFDMERSGARIAWDYYFPGAKPPQLLLHVEDRDLWHFALPQTRKISANLFSYPYDFSVWDELMRIDPVYLIADGIAILRKQTKDIAELLEAVTMKMLIGNWWVNAANLPYTMASEAAGILAIGNPFGACYWDTPQGRKFSLRSMPDGLDVSEIAQLYGGGGHRNSAGFTVTFEQARLFNTLYLQGED